jgi:hypothetical protein
MLAVLDGSLGTCMDSNAAIMPPLTVAIYWRKTGDY